MKGIVENVAVFDIQALYSIDDLAILTAENPRKYCVPLGSATGGTKGVNISEQMAADYESFIESIEGLIEYYGFKVISDGNIADYSNGYELVAVQSDGTIVARFRFVIKASMDSVDYPHCKQVQKHEFEEELVIPENIREDLNSQPHFSLVLNNIEFESYDEAFIEMDHRLEKRVSCSFTGHRPEKLLVSEKEVIKRLEEQVVQAIQDGYSFFISGMQRGVDIWAAEVVLKKRNEGESVKLIAASAFKGMENRWTQDWINRYNYILKEADNVYFIGDKPGKKSFIERDHWMVDNSSRLISVFTGASGGTKETIEYAKGQGIEIVLISKSNDEKGKMNV